MSNSKWQVFDLAEVRDKLKGEAVEYLEFLNVPALNCGVYFLAAGSTDMQAPTTRMKSTWYLAVVPACVWTKRSGVSFPAHCYTWAPPPNTASSK